MMEGVWYEDLRDDYNRSGIQLLKLCKIMTKRKRKQIERKRRFMQIRTRMSEL